MGDDVAHALRASQGGGDKPHVLAPIAFDTKASGRNGFGVGEIAPTLRAMGHKDSHTNAGGQIGVAYPLDLRNASRDPDKRDAQNRQGAGIGNDGDPSPTLTKEFVPGVATQWAVRRLTPTECARLQGFSDDHCRIPWRGKPAEQCPDGPQYKAYGNSMSTNVMRWIGQRIELVDQIASEQTREVTA
jgi:DNA (cytosine-5)-methyltransferase 1